MRVVDDVHTLGGAHKCPLESSRYCCIAGSSNKVCVCVCQPLGQGFPTATSTPTFYPLFHRQGAEGSPVVASANEAPHWMIRKTYLRRDTTPLFLAVFLMPWWLIMILSLQTGFSQLLLAADCQPRCTSFSDLSPCGSVTFLPIGKLS